MCPGITWLYSLHPTENTGRKLNDHNTYTCLRDSCIWKRVKSTHLQHFQISDAKSAWFPWTGSFWALWLIELVQKADYWFLASSSNDVTKHNNYIIICVNTYCWLLPFIHFTYWCLWSQFIANPLLQIQLTNSD